VKFTIKIVFGWKKVHVAPKKGPPFLDTRARPRFGYWRLLRSPRAVRRGTHHQPSAKLKLIPILCVLCAFVVNPFFIARGVGNTRARSNAQSTYNRNRADLENQRHRAPSTRADSANPMGPAAKPAHTQTRQTSQLVRRCMLIQPPMLKPRTKVSSGYAINQWLPCAARSANVESASRATEPGRTTDWECYPRRESALCSGDRTIVSEQQPISLLATGKCRH